MRDRLRENGALGKMCSSKMYLKCFFELFFSLHIKNKSLQVVRKVFSSFLLVPMFCFPYENKQCHQRSHNVMLEPTEETDFFDAVGVGKCLRVK